MTIMESKYDYSDCSRSVDIFPIHSEIRNFSVVADYFGNTKQYTPYPGRKIHWPGGRKGPPPDTPTCGFDNSKCPPKEPFPNYLIVIIVLGSSLVVVLIVTFFVYRHFRLESELAEMNWRVRWDDIMFGGPTRNGKKMDKQNPHRNSYHSDCSADTIAVHLNDVGNRQLFTKTGYYKGAILAIKPISRTHISITKPLLVEIKKDVLENDQIKLDWMFRYSIMQDIVRGMTYLHSTDIKSHGHLKSSNCVVDSRFVVKITDFGLHYFKEKEEELEEDTYAIERSKLWMAPELLRMTNPSCCGTQKGDVYSFAIICQEIVYRNGAFYLQNLDLSPKEITEKLKKSIRPLFRPTLEEFDCPNDELARVIRRCWAEEPSERPDFQALRTMIKKLNKDGDKGDILDNLLTRMEQYANNLEALVEERTADYLQEKKKAEELLYNMLPKSVALQLIRGESIAAEWYDGVTIYFSDICGFTALSAASTPMQVVDLLNDLYTVFDSIVEHFDVYKGKGVVTTYWLLGEEGSPYNIRQQGCNEPSSSTTTPASITTPANTTTTTTTAAAVTQPPTESSSKSSPSSSPSSIACRSHTILPPPPPPPPSSSSSTSPSRQEQQH
ncbi:guanylate cyclase [Elysia marginata]|uniref:guanylate cyclase n=1 Tax=Elysia marginata TaxID=1093978 RepID=A0AAV4HMI3_9GAST|nr:guanylate cyclase [Elysia marginata]